MNEALKTVLDFIAKTVTDVDKSLSDGWQWRDAFNFTGEVFSAPAFVKAFPEAVKYMKTNKDTAKLEAITYFKEKLDLPHDKAERKIESIFDLILQAEETYFILREK